MELLSFMAANPWLAFFVMLIMAALLSHLLSVVRDMYISTIWCIRGIYPVISKSVDTTELEAAKDKVVNAKKEEDDENKLKDCR